MNALLSSREGSIFGSFYYPYGMLEHTATPQIIERVFGKEQATHDLNNVENLEELISVAYQASSILHETRHFYDQFGTLAGISLFSTFIEATKAFSRAAARISLDSGSWQWPVRTWAADKAAPSEVRKLVRQVRAFRTGAELLLGTFDSVAVDGHREEVFAEAATRSGQTIDVVPIRVGVLSSDGTHASKSILYPVGVEALFEANAHAITRDLVEHLFPKEVADRLTENIVAIESKGKDSAGGIGHNSPYMVLDRQITKFLRSKGKETFNRATVLGVADEVLGQAFLSISHLSDAETRIEASRLGHLIRQTLETTPIDDLVAGRVPVTSLVDDTYKALLDSYEKGGDWDTVEDDGTLMSSIRIWESYAAQHFTVPLLKCRMASEHRVFRSSEGTYELFKKLVPPIISNGEGIIFDLPDRVRLAWANVLMAGQMMQSIAMSDTVLCPRAFSTVPALDRCSFSSKYTCDDYMLVGCGKFDGLSAESTPCLFTHLLRSFKFLQ